MWMRDKQKNKQMTEKETKEKLLSLIKHLGITQKKASEILGITQATFSRKKKGVDGYSFKDSDLEKIKEFYNVKN